MKSPEQIGKIEAVVLYILQHFKSGVDYIKLFKIMYFAQREYLATYGMTIVEDTFKARMRGPVPSLTYKVVKMVENDDTPNGEASDLEDFASAIRIDGHKKIFARKEPDMDYISDMERKELDETINKYKDVDSMDLSELSHDSAYQQALKNMADDPEKDVLTIIDIARAGHATEDMVKHIREVQLIKSDFEC